MVPQSMPMKIGKHWASALAGFMAGAAVAAIVLVPWMLVQGQFCEEAAFPKVNPLSSEQIQFTDDGEQILEAATAVQP
jgi:hypothetical protein